jgi:Tfp pilus assembly protein PilX
MRLSKRLRRRASALIITLALVVLMTIIAIGMFTATRMEVAASKLHLDGVRADQLAQVGRSVALAKLQTGLAGTNRAWMSQPGRLVTSPISWNSTPARRMWRRCRMKRRT